MEGKNEGRKKGEGRLFFREGAVGIEANPDRAGSQSKVSLSLLYQYENIKV